MEKLFYPKSVAVFGVSENEKNLGRNILQNLFSWGYQGEIHPVGLKEGEVLGRRIYTSVLDVPSPVDLAQVLTPAQTVPRIIEQCAKKNIRWMCISSGGFSEYGGKGNPYAKEILKTARKHSIRFVGPNGISIINAEIGLCLPFAPLSEIPGGDVSVMSQSGGVGLSLLMMLSEGGAGLNKFVSLGNKADLDEVDFLRYLGEDEGTRVIVMYLESVARGKEFMEVCRNIKKPVLLFKGNTTSAGAKTASAHTAAISNNNEVLESAMKQAGVLRVESLHQLIPLIKFFNLPSATGKRIVLISPSGGLNVVAVDQGSRMGFSFPPLPENSLQEVGEFSRAGVIRLRNPLDLGDTFSAEALLLSVERALQQNHVDAVVLFMLRRGTKEIYTGIIKGMQKDLTDDLLELMQRYNKPVVIILMAGSEVVAAARKTAPVPVLERPEDAFFLLDLYLRFCRRRKKKFKPAAQQLFTGRKKVKIQDAILEIRKDRNFGNILCIFSRRGITVRVLPVSLDDLKEVVEETGLSVKGLLKALNIRTQSKQKRRRKWRTKMLL